MNRRIVAALMVLMALAVSAADVDRGYRIESWKYEANVQADNTWDVTETMQVNFLEERHGIYRFIPRLFVRHRPVNVKDAKYTYKTRIEDVWVNDSCTMSDTDDGQDNLLLRIGRGDRTVTGRQTYVIRYRLVYPDDRYVASDELMHTVLGADCNTSIDEFVFNIRFDKPLPPSFRNSLHVYSGEWGTDGNRLNVVANVVGDDMLSGRIADVPPFNAVTIQGVLPEGFWEESYTVNPWTCHLLLAVATVLFGFTMVCLLLNRRKRPTVVIEYNAPDGISSAEVGVIMDNVADFEDLASLVVWFASKGYLRIRELEAGKGLFGRKDPDLELVRLRDLPDDAPAYQKLFWKALFAEGDAVVLSKLRDKKGNIRKALSALGRHFRGERNLTSLYWLPILSALCFLSAGVMAIGRSGCVSAWDSSMMLFAVVLWCLPLLLAIILRMVFSCYDMINSRTVRFLQYAAILAFGALDVLVLRVFFYNPYDSFLSVDTLSMLVGGGWLVALFAGRMMRDTDYRREKMSLLLGFREFIAKSELPMLKAQVDENPSYFYDVLPYAMVFGLTKKWQKQFRDIEMPVPEWYEFSGSAGTLTSYVMAENIVRSVSHTVDKAIVSAISHDINSGSSSSSSSFGGGFSGGGGGGGGVGSW